MLWGLLAAMVLAGCTATPDPKIPHDAEAGGQTQSQLDAELASIVGLTVTSAAGSRPNVKGNTGYAYALVIDPAYEVADVAGLVDFLVASAWSVREGYMPNSTIDISVSVGAEPTELVDLVDGAEQAGWVPEGSQPHGLDPSNGGSERQFNPGGTTKVTIWIDSQNVSDPSSDTRGAVANRERLGDWPGDVPELPAGLIVPRGSTTP